MRLSEFIMLSEEEKKWTLMQQGTPLAKREYDTCKILLFQLDDFYVETVCNLESKAVEEFRAFGVTQLLQPYLQAIPLDDLFN